jgi:hypothetical protein
MMARMPPIPVILGPVIGPIVGFTVGATFIFCAVRAVNRLSDPPD